MDRQVRIRFVWMLAAILGLGTAISILFIADMGTDPLTTMIRGFTMITPLSYGNCQLLFNILLIVLAVFFRRDLIGAGTIANMVLVGYVAEYLEIVWRSLPFIGDAPGIGIRILMLLIGVVLFISTAAIYMTAELGVSPYDALPIIISEKVPFSFRTVRITVDVCAVCVGWLCGNMPGILTVLVVLSLGPVITWFGKHVAVKLFGKVTSFV